MRIVSWNIENLAPWLDGGLAEQVARLGDPDVLLLQEIRLRPRDRELIARLPEAVPGYRCDVALCDDPRNVTHRGGRAHGVATLARIPLTSEHPAWDREGRVLVSRAGDLSVINLYAVNGTSRPYVDPETGAPAGDRHAFKRRFQAQVVALARALGPCVIGGDWNVSPSALDVHPRLRSEEPHAQARRELAAALADAHLVDAYRARHPDARGYTWFARGRKDYARVDYFAVSAELMPRVTRAEILADPALRGRSDHAPIVLEL